MKKAPGETRYQVQRNYVAHVWKVVTSVILTLSSVDAYTEALPDHDNGPLTGIFGFPDSADNSEIILHGRHEWDTSLITASHSIDDTRGDENLLFDGETTRLALGYRYGFSDKLQIGIEIPYLWHQSGSLDSAIDRWHKIFGLPDGARDTRAQDQLEFRYSTPDGTVLDFGDNSNGFGDVRLLAGLQLSKTALRSMILQLGIKAPTGDSATLLGSGGADLSVGIAVDITELWGNAKLSGLYRANVTRLGKPDWLADRYNEVVGQLAFGIAYQVRQNIELRMQSRIRSAVYDSAIENLGDPSVALTFGADFRIAERYRLALSVGEDLLPSSAPDVSFQLALRYAGPRAP